MTTDTPADDLTPAPTGVKTIDHRVLDRYRALVANFTTATDAANAAAHRRHDARMRLNQLQMDRNKMTSMRHCHSQRREEHATEVAALDAEISKAQARFDRLAAEETRLQERSSAANQLARRCCDYLVETHGMSRKDLEG